MAHVSILFTLAACSSDHHLVGLDPLADTGRAEDTGAPEDSGLLEDTGFPGDTGPGDETSEQPECGIFELEWTATYKPAGGVSLEGAFGDPVTGVEESWLFFDWTEGPRVEMAVERCGSFQFRGIGVAHAEDGSDEVWSCMLQRDGDHVLVGTTRAWWEGGALDVLIEPAWDSDGCGVLVVVP